MKKSRTRSKLKALHIIAVISLFISMAVLQCVFVGVNGIMAICTICLPIILLFLFSIKDCEDHMSNYEFEEIISNLTDKELDDIIDELYCK